MRILICLFLELAGASAVAQSSAATNTVTESGARAAGSLAAGTLSGHVPDDKYKPRAGDKLSLQILADRDLPKSLVVADSGELDVPYIGRVMVADKTCKQAAQELKSQLEEEYYYRATVIL